MHAMTGADASMTLGRSVPARGLADLLALRIVVPLATMLSIGAVSLLLLFTPVYLHAALDSSDSAGWLGMTPATVHDYSDRTVADLVWGPATFDFAAPDGTSFYSADERGHMRDVRTVLYGFLAVAAIGALAMIATGALRRGDRAFYRAVQRAGAILVVATVVVGVFAAVAFDAVFELFHRLLFPGGNFTFDPGTQRLVQLYPYAFWELTGAALGILLLVGGAGAWFVGRRMSGRVEQA